MRFPFRLARRLAVRCIATLPLAAFCFLHSTPAFAAFTEVSAEAGIVYTQHTPNVRGFCLFPENTGFCEAERMTGGAAVADFDRDGWPDLYVTRMNLPDILYRNNGDGTFNDVTAAAGLFFTEKTNAAWWADFNRDGRLDLFLTTVGGSQNYLYMNRGNGTFYEAAEASGVALNDGLSHLSYTPAVGDYNNDGYPDIFTVEWSIGFFSSESSVPRVRLLRNRGAESPGHFDDVTADAGTYLHTKPPTPARGVFGFGAAFVDLDSDGFQDLAVAADFGTSTLLWNNGDGTFTDGTVAANVGTDENGMGSTFGDYDGDGDLDWFVTSIFDPDETCESIRCNWGYSGNRLYRYEGNRTFADVTVAAGVADGGWGWGTAFLDHDNDGDLDLVMTNGVVFPGVTPPLDKFEQDRMRAWTNDDGIMTESSDSLALTDTQSGKGLLTFDYDRDGDLDLFIVNNAATPLLYRNDSTAGNHSFRVAFQGPGDCDFEGLHARVTVVIGNDYTQIREMGAATHYLGQSERVAHFGLGADETVDSLVVAWPRTGEVQTFENLEADQTFVVTPPAGITDVLSRVHSADKDGDFRLDLGELLRCVQFYNTGSYHLDFSMEDGFAPGPGDQAGTHHAADFNLPDWRIDLSELLRVIQLFNSRGFVRNCGGEDGFSANV